MEFQNLDELKKLRVVDLKERLAKLGKSTSGLKADLVDRLYNALAEKSGQVDLSAAAPSYVQMCTTGAIPAMGEQEPPVVEVTIDTSQFDMGVQEPQIVTMDQYNVMDNVHGMGVQMDEQSAYYQRQQEDEQQLRQQQEEMWRQQQHEEQLRQQQEAEEHYRQQEFQRQQELELRRQQEEQELRRQQEEQELRRQQEEQELRRQQEEQELRRQQEEQLRLQQEEEYRLRQEEEMRNFEEEVRRQQEAEMIRQREIELERQRQIELEEQKRLEEEQRLEIERQRQLMEIQRQKELELERQRHLEEERRQKELELERQRKLEAAQRQKELELERQRQLEEAQKQKELEEAQRLQLERQRMLEEEAQRQKELEELRQRELEEQRQRELEEQRQREIMLEKQRQKEIELQQQKELELQRQKELEELQRQTERELERQRELEKQEELERERQREKEEEEKKIKYELELQKQRAEEQMHALYEEELRKEQREQLRREEEFRKRQEQDLLEKQKAEEELQESLKENETVPGQEEVDSEVPEQNYEMGIGIAKSVIQHTNDVEKDFPEAKNLSKHNNEVSKRAGEEEKQAQKTLDKENHSVDSKSHDAMNGERVVQRKVKLTKSQRRKIKKKRRQVNRREASQQRAANYDEEEPREDVQDVEVQYVGDKVELNPTDPMFHHFMKIFETFKLTDPEQARREAEEAAAKAKLDAKKEPDLRKKPKDADEEPEFDSKKDEQPKLSKRKLKQLTRLSIAELKQHVNRPDVVEMHDVTAKDPKLLVLLKSTRNTVPVPRHWCFKRKFLQGKRGIEKPPFNLPEFIKKTGIMEMRQALQEKEDQKTLKAKMREKVRPKMGKIDIDYQKLHDAFFKWQTKPRMTIHGDLYYEGKEYETRLKEKKPGELSDDLRTALGMPVGPGSQKTPPPWLIAMQRYGPPPSYPNLKIPGLNSPIPDGCSFGYHAGGWGKPPVDELGRPLYGDVFGTTSADYQNNIPEEEVDRSHWGELESESESESEVEEEEEEVGEGEDDIDKDGLVTPADGGLATPSGLSSVTMGMETPDLIELRKRKIESEMESGENPALYTVLPEKKTDRVGGVMMGSTHVYDMSAAAKAVRVGHGTDSGVDVALDPSELDMDQATMTARYEQTLREQRSQLEKEDLSDMVAEHTAKQKNKRKRAAGQDVNRSGKKYKDFKF
ncbi:Splicing factor 3B subunit 2 [Chamberlinius hualienensis]